ncbi:hypothetical protein [Kaarinaea lacus]
MKRISRLCRKAGIFTICIFFGLPVYAASVIAIDVEITKDGQPRKKSEIVTIDGDRARIDFLGEVKKRIATTPYLLTIDGGKSWVLGNSLKGEFYCANVDPVDFFKKIGVIVTDVVALVNPKVLDIKVEKKREEKGPRIMDFPTTYVQLVTTATGEATFMFKKYKYTMKVTDDIWYTNEVEVQPFRKRWFEALTQSGYEKLDQAFTDWASGLSGPILKLESEIIITNVIKNESDTQKEKAVITSIKEVKTNDLAKDTFTVPKCENINQKQLESTAKEMAKEGKLGL